jgi:hypothetical protein
MPDAFIPGKRIKRANTNPKAGTNKPRIDVWFFTLDLLCVIFIKILCRYNGSFKKINSGNFHSLFEDLNNYEGGDFEEIVGKVMGEIGGIRRG